MSPTFSWQDLNHWNIGWPALLLLAAAGALYVGGVRQVANWPRIRTVSFLTGLVVTFLATQSVLGTVDMGYVSAHMIQHLALIMVAAPLFAAAAPMSLLDQALSPTWLRVRTMGVIFHPLVAFFLYAVFIPLTHLTTLFDFMLRAMWFHHLEQADFLVVGYLFFRAAFGIEGDKPLHPGLRLVYVMAAVPVDTITGLALSMSSHISFPTYPSVAPMGTSAAWQLSNIHLGGAIMWIGGDALMLLACFPIAIAWVKSENRRTKALDAELDRLGL